MYLFTCLNSSLKKHYFDDKETKILTQTTLSKKTMDYYNSTKITKKVCENGRLVRPLIKSQGKDLSLSMYEVSINFIFTDDWAFNWIYFANIVCTCIFCNVLYSRSVILALQKMLN